MANNIRQIDENSYFTQYAWALENCDVKSAFNDFLNKELNIKDENIKKQLYDDYIKHNITKNITKLELDVLNYILKYEYSSYYAGEEIVRIDENKGEQSFKILEPGYYLITLKGASGMCKGITRSQYHSSEIVTFTDNSNYLYINKNLNFHLELKSASTIRIYNGYVEENENHLFLFQLGEVEIKDSKTYQVGSFDEKNFIVGNENGTFLDYANFNDNPLSSNFYTITLINNGIILKNQAFSFDEDTYISGIDSIHAKEITDKIKESFYKKTIIKNLEYHTLKSNSYSTFLKDDNKSNIFNKNILHGGDGGSISFILYVENEKTFTYNIGCADNDKNTTTFIKSTDGKYFAFAEKGANTDSSSNFTFTDLQKNQGLLDVIKTTNFEDQASDSLPLNEMINFHVGENFDYNTFYAGCGRGAIIIDNKVRHQYYGGGKNGEGVRLNEFKVAYYQRPGNGQINITYLGSKYSKKASVKLSTENCASQLYIENDTFPIIQNIHLQLSFNNLSGAFEISGDNQKNSLFINRKRYLNYVECDIDIKKITEPKQILFKYNKDLKYISYDEDETKFTNLTGKFNDCFLGYDKDLQFNAKAIGSFSLNTALISAYNSSNFLFDKEFICKLEEFNPTSYKSVYRFANFENLKIFNEVFDIIVVSFTKKNTLNLNKYVDPFGNEIFGESTGKIASISYKLDSIESNFFDYQDGFKIYVAKNTKFFIKLEYSSSRIRLDESLSSFVGITNIYKKNIDFDGSYIEDTYFSKDSKTNFQIIEFIPSTSQDINLFIEKNTYSVSISPDLYGNFNIVNIFNKIEYEVGEEVSLSFSLKNYLRVSHLLNRQTTGKHTLNNSTVGGSFCYKYFDDSSKFESFFKIGKNEFNLASTTVESLLSRQDFNLGSSYLGKITKKTDDEITSDCGIFSVSSRKVDTSYKTDKGPIYNGTKSLISNLFLKSVSAINEETVQLNFFMKENDLNIRLSSNYNIDEVLFIVENSFSSYQSIFKQYFFKVYCCGGPTGNGENAGGINPRSETEPDLGGPGGDGYFGGNGSPGGSTRFWTVSLETWHSFIPTDLALKTYYGAPGGFPGRGFIKPGNLGSDGDSGLGNACAAVTVDTNDDISPSGVPQPAYCGIPFCGVFFFGKKNENFLNTTMYVKAGTKGLDLLTNTYRKYGRGGGAGLPSFFTIMNSDSYVKFIEISEDYKKLSYTGLDAYSNVEKNSFVFEGGVAGLSHTFEKRTQNEICDQIWSLADGVGTPARWCGVPATSWFYNEPLPVSHSSDWFLLHHNQNSDSIVSKRLVDMEYFTSTGYPDPQYKFHTLSQFDKIYDTIVTDNEDNFQSIKNTVFLYNTNDNFSNSDYDLNTDRQLGDWYVNELQFNGQNCVSYENGIVKFITYKNDNNIGRANSISEILDDGKDDTIK